METRERLSLALNVRSLITHQPRRSSPLDATHFGPCFPQETCSPLHVDGAFCLWLNSPLPFLGQVRSSEFSRLELELSAVREARASAGRGEGQQMWKLAWGAQRTGCAWRRDSRTAGQQEAGEAGRTGCSWTGRPRQGAYVCLSSHIQVPSTGQELVKLDLTLK